MVINYCCEEMKRAVEEDSFNNAVKDGYLEYSYEYENKIKLNYCPACGLILTPTSILVPDTKPKDTS